MNKTLLLLFTLLLWCSGNSLQAQQWHYYNPTAWFDVNAIDLLGPGIIVIGGGQETNDSVQIMFQSQDYGLNWYENAHDGIAPWNKSVAFSDSVNGLGVGNNGRIISTGDAGRNWGFPVYPINRDLNKIVYAGTGTYYIAGGNMTNDSIQTILKSTDFGNTWNVIYDTLGPWLRSIYFIDRFKGFAVGDNGVILATTNGGSAWFPVTSPIQRDFNAITFTDADTGYIVGGTPTGLCHRTILRTVNGGIDWSVLIDHVGGILNDISFADAHVGYIVGDSATVLKTTDGGFNWLPLAIDTNLSGSEIFNAVKFYDPDFGAIGGKNGKLYVYYNPILVATQTGNAYIYSSIQAELHARINSHGLQTSYSFRYSTDSTFSHSSVTRIQSITTNYYTDVSARINNLMADTLYYYFISALDMSGVSVYGDTLTFSTHLPYLTLRTENATPVSENTITLHASADHIAVPMYMYFQYGTSPSSFDYEVRASPALISDASMHPISLIVGSLQPFKQYNFRIKGVTQHGIYCGNTISFSNGTLATDNPTTFSGDSAIFNGTIHHSSVPLTLSFEYGTTSLLGNEISAFPFICNDTSLHTVSASIDSLHHNTVYFYRLKGTAPNKVYYGNIKQFFNGTLYNTFQPTEASNITSTSATLNGYADHFAIPANIAFDFGEDNGGSWIMINANPSYISDTRSHVITASVSSLIPNTMYSYNLRATTNSGTFSAGTFFSGRMYFFTGTLFRSFQTLSPTNVLDDSAIFNGYIDGLKIPAYVRFEYGLTPDLGHIIPANPGYISDSSAYLFSAHIRGLSHSTRYYYRLTANIPTGPLYGDTISFISANSTILSINIEAKSGTEITNTSAKLNGKIMHLDFPVQLSFEYGTTESFGNTIVAVPGDVYDTMPHSVYANLTGLQPNTFYYFRLKAVNGTTRYYSNKVKLYTAECEIPNCGFELWDTVQMDKPDQWTIIGFSEKATSYNGTYAIKISGENAGGATAMLSGDVNKELDGGIPFHARPDSILCHIKYDVVPGDTAYLIAFFKLDNIVLSQLFFPITGNSGGSFKRMSYPITFPDSRIPDTLITGAFSTNFREGQANPASMLTLDDLSFTGQGSDIVIPNSDFENWNTVFMENPVSWLSNPKSRSDSAKFVSKTNDKIGGKYAVFMKNNIYITNNPASLEAGIRNVNDKPAFPVGGRHHSLNFFAKYLPENNDTLIILLNMYSNGRRIGGIFSQVDTAVLTYSPFNIPIIYPDTISVPDSASLSFYTGSSIARGNSMVWIDQLSFDGFSFIDTSYNGIAEIFKNMLLNIYPNPSNSKVYLDYYSPQRGKLVFSVFDIYGKLLYCKTENMEQPGLISNQIDISAYSSGVYLISVSSGKSVSVRKLIIQK